MNNVAELIKSAQQLAPGDFQVLYDKVQAIWTERHFGQLEQQKKRILKKIARGMPSGLYLRWNYLIGLRDSNTLSIQEQEELIQLTHEVEKHEIQRLKWIAELAELLKLSVEDVLQQYQIEPQ